MHAALWISLVLVALVAFFVVVSIGWRYASRRWTLPCPSLFSFAVDDGPFGWFLQTERTIDRIGFGPGMTVVEVGPGTGRLLLRAARRVLPGGTAIGIELQEGMLAKIRAKLTKSDPGNVRLIHADARQAVLPPASADIIYMCTVLGEIPDQPTALAHCVAALKPGGRLSITEIIFDPHYVSRTKLDKLARAVGLKLDSVAGNWRTYTANFTKPG